MKALKRTLKDGQIRKSGLGLLLLLASFIFITGCSSTNKRQYRALAVAPAGQNAMINISGPRI